MARLLLIVVVDLFRFVKKEQRIGANSSKNNYIGTKKPEIKKPFAFLVSKICVCWSFK